MNIKIFTFCFCFFCGLFSTLKAQSLAICIEPKAGIQSIVYTALQREVWVMTGDTFPEMICTLNARQNIRLSVLGAKVQISREGKVLGQWPEVILWSSDSSARFTLMAEGMKKPVEYYDHLRVQVRKNQLRLINDVWMEHYICGVVAAEGGIYKTPEFLKVQAVCSRTYAVRNMGKYARDGFDLNDKVDCQVYHGIPVNLPGVNDAVKATEGLIAVDDFGEPIDAVFSANCGGQSANSEDVWTSPSAYLKSTESYDQYREFRNSSWSLTLSKPELLFLFSKYYKSPVTHFKIEPDYSGRVRQVRLNDDSKSVISGMELRALLKLKSTKFRMYEWNNQIFISGQGFGHGVGMCQDGAYKLSTIGWSHEEILRHFYSGIELIPIQEYLLLQQSLMRTPPLTAPGE